MNELLADIAPSLIREIDRRKRIDSIDLGLGEPIKKPSLEPLRQAFSWVEQHGCPYTTNAGFVELRTAIAHYFRFPGMVSSDAVCVTVGSQEALHIAIKALLTPGQDEVLVVSPAYPLYVKLCMMEGVAVREVRLKEAEGFLPRAELVLAALKPKTRMIILGTPNNPTGQIWSKEELQKLTEGLMKAPHPIYLLSDEVYREIYFTKEAPHSPAEFYPFAIVIGSISKSCALTGLRLGWILASPALMPVLWKVHQFAVTCANTFAQRVALAIFQENGYLSAHRSHYIEKWEYVSRALTKAQISFIPTEGSFYCLLKLTERFAKDSMSASLFLLQEENVVTIPGIAFGAEGYLRMTFVAPNPMLDTGLQRIAAFLARHS